MSNREEFEYEAGQELKLPVSIIKQARMGDGYDHAFDSMSVMQPLNQWWHWWQAGREGMDKKFTDMAVQLANAESKCRGLAAELSAVDKIHNEAVFITDDHYEQCPSEVQKMIRSLAVLQIPACDAFLAEVRAEGVDLVCDYHRARCEALYDVDRKGYQRHGAALCDAIDVAAQLRKGASL